MRFNKRLGIRVGIGGVAAVISLVVLTGVGYAQEPDEEIADLIAAIDTAWLLIAAFLVFFMQAGFAPVVKAALEETGYPGMTITEVRGHGIQKGVTQQWRGREFVVEFLPKVKLEVVVTSDADVDRILALIHDNAATGEIGDGKVFVTEIADVMRVRTGERGEAAV